ncbi:MAG: biopolymer transporter ExbD [Bacteroidetes bacterium]|nr:biopolymer transporter ExbD [Bacteroidota bacterium]
MKFRSNERKYIVAFSYASLTDVVLQLLIFFLLSSAFVIQSGIKVHLPRAVHQEQETKGQITITITADGRVYLNNLNISLSALRNSLATLLEQRPNDLVVIHADRSVTLQQTVDVMDIAKSAGAVRFFIATAPAEK